MTTFATRSDPAHATSYVPAPQDAQDAAAVAPDPSILASNLAALSRRNPRLAEAVLAATPSAGVRFFATDDGVLSAELDGRALASKRRPLEEARRLADTLDPATAGCAAVLGFGVGHHVRLLAERMETVGVVACFEPDLSLLRAVLEHIDHSSWLAAGTTAIFHDADDRSTITSGVQGWEAPLAVGVQIIEHAPSRPRLGEASGRFAQALSSVVGTVRTHVITTMVHADVTARNALMNIGHYAGKPGIGELQGLALGRPAIVVSAGPSLRRTIARLKDPAVRERCVIVAVQTVLKQLIAEGIRPHFVCALDHHEVSRRFYEGLTADDVKGITLVAEPKANAAILDAFPGEKRLVADEFLEELLSGDAALAGSHAPMRPGATVAHLAYYLARFLGADPVILTGQDLAFTDGQYYSAGAAIHDTWAPELNAFNTLEMMEWQRIVRMRGNLHAMTDHLGRPVYSDDQMVAYLHQFERDFMEDDARGLTVIDATEGGVRKTHAVTMPMGEAIEMHVRHARPLPAFPTAADAEGAQKTGGNAALKSRLQQVRTDVRTIARLSREARDMLIKLAGRLNDADRANALIRQVHALRDRVEALRPAYALVHRINQAGTFKRFKADRAIRIEKDLSPASEQRRRVERDSMNVGWIADSADSLDDLLAASIASLDGAPKRTRDVASKPDADNVSGIEASTRPTLVTGAVVILDTIDDVERRCIPGTLSRLSRSGALRRVAIVTDDEPRAREAIGGPILGLDVHFHGTDLAAWRERRAAVRSARAWAGHCWRGGIGGMTAFDEAFDPCLAAWAMERENLDAALLLGPTWTALDPQLTKAVVERFAENAETQPLCFTQAPPGLCGCVVSRQLVTELAKGVESASPLASIGGVLGYRPMNARSDPIAQPCCITIPPDVRGTLVRMIADQTWSAEKPGQNSVMDHTGNAVSASAACATARAAQITTAHNGPSEIVLIIASATGYAELNRIEARIRAAASVGSVPSLALTGHHQSGHDVLGHPQAAQILAVIAELKAAGRFRAVHVRTSLAVDPLVFSLTLPAISSIADVVSVDCIAGAAETYEALTGRAAFDTMMTNIDTLLAARKPRGGLLTPWIVPRITRRDAVYAEIESFFDKAMLVAGWGVIDPSPAPIAGDRIEPLPLPAAARVKELLTIMEIDASGSAAIDRVGGQTIPVEPDGIAAAWAQVLTQRLAVIENDARLKSSLTTGV
jgi:hypothetical protein